MKKTMFRTLVVFFAMLFCAGFAAGQTETEIINQDEVPAAQPEWCNGKCITVPVVNGQGFLRAMEKASAANSLAFSAFQFTKLKHEDGSNIVPGEAPQRGDVFYLAMDDIFDPPDRAAISAFFAAEQPKTGAIVTPTQEPEDQPDDKSEEDAPGAGAAAPPKTPIDAPAAAPSAADPPKQPPQLFIKAPQTAIYKDTGFFFVGLFAVSALSILFVLYLCAVRGKAILERSPSSRPRGKDILNLNQ